MFDNHSAPPNNSAPNNLPVGEPDDMFANAGIQNDFAADPIAVPVPMPSNNPAEILSEPPVSLPTALDAGVLKPRNQPAASPEPADLFTARPDRMAPVTTTPPNGLPLVESSVPPRVPENVLRAPMGGRTVWITVATLLSLGIVSAAGAWVYFAYINPEPEVTAPVETKPEVITPPTTQPTETTEEVTSVTSTDSEILFGETILDTDSDGLDDLYEKKNGTNMLEWDTDGDGLSDGDEVMTWKTDPLKVDTDNDTYSDTTEIRNGYNPRGDGKLFPVTPTTTPSTVSVSST